MNNETVHEKIKLFPHEITIVGVVRKDQEATVIATIKDGQPVSPKDLATAMMAKFQFIRRTSLSDAAKAADLKDNDFFHIRLSDTGGEMITLPNGKTMRRNKRTVNPGYDVVFRSQKADLFNELKEEIIAKRFKPVADDPTTGEIVLTEFVANGKYDEFPLGFYINPRVIDPKTGARVKLQQTRRLDDGTYKKEDAVSNMGRHFIYDADVDKLEELRDAYRKRVEEYKIPNPVATDQASSGTDRDKAIAPEPKPGSDEPEV